MKVTLLLCLLVGCWAEPLNDDQIRDEIAQAARDSAQLAEDLANMLEELEEGEERQEGRRGRTLDQELQQALKVTEELAIASRGQRRRKGKARQSQSERKSKSSTLDNLLDILEASLTEELKEEEEEEEEERNGQGRSGGDEEFKSGEGRTGGEEEATCQTKEVANDIQICVPDFQPKSRRQQVPGQEVQEGKKWCYQQTLTVCEVGEADGEERQVCSFNYIQASHNAAAVSVEMTIEEHSEKMGVTHCHHVKSDSYGAESELCELVLVSQHYRLPTVEKQDLELLDMQYPEPQEQCEDYLLSLPTTHCKHKTKEACVTPSHLANRRQTVSVGHPTPSYRGNCQQISVTQQQQECTVDKHESISLGEAGQRRGYSG